MSSMRNAVQRRNHRERAQPLERQKWGVLEKHKDYSLRAKDYNEKKKRLQTLWQKAAERNSDEFHFGMTSSKAHDKGQKFADRGNPVLSHDAVKLLKTQDAGYLKTMAQQTRKLREKLEQEYILHDDDEEEEVLNGAQGKPSNRHLIFVDTAQEQKQSHARRVFEARGAIIDPANEFSGIEQGNSREPGDETETESRELQAHCQPETYGIDGDVIKDSVVVRERSFRKQRKRAHEARMSRLKLLKLREKNLVAAEQELKLQRAKMSNNVGGVDRAGVRWKIRERKK